MMYLGGKTNLSKKIAPILERLRKPNQLYLEPFMGLFSVGSKLKGDRVASDYHFELVELFKAVQSGWIPPEIITQADYDCAKMGYYPPYLTAFIGFGCSFSGKYFGGFARNKQGNRNFASEAKRSLEKQYNSLKDVMLFNLSYTAYQPTDCLIYCDPPYQNTTKYSNSNGFDHLQFWDKMREWSKANTVVISEYNAPKDFKCIQEFKHTTGLKNKSGNGIAKIERLFVYNG